MSNQPLMEVELYAFSSSNAQFFLTPHEFDARTRGSSAASTVVSASAAASHSRTCGCASSAARYAPASPAGCTSYVRKRNATGA